MVKRDIKCSHYIGDGYYYKLIDDTIFICARCNKKLLFQMKQQEIIEDEMVKMIRK